MHKKLWALVVLVVGCGVLGCVDRGDIILPPSGDGSYRDGEPWLDDDGYDRGEPWDDEYLTKRHLIK